MTPEGPILLTLSHIQHAFVLACLIFVTGCNSSVATRNPSSTHLSSPIPAAATKEVTSPLATSTPASVIAIPTASNPPGSRGAAVPWIEYEAEDGQTSGEALLPDRTFGTIPAESSGRRAVRLDRAGEYVQFQSTGPANSVVVRFVIPDSEDGQGLEATISLYVDNVFRQKIRLTSKYAWSYGGEEETFNVPRAGGAHHFYDEARALVGDIPAGATVKLQKDASDNAEYYVIDLIDLEQVSPPRTKPEGYLSIVEDCGAIPDDGLDDGAAIQDCIDRARAAQTGVWIPAGVFESTTRPFEVSDVIIQGAGMWYSTIRGFYARFNCVGNNCRYFDFAILGETVLRDDKSPENGFNGGAGTDSRLENIWIEHTKVGYWVGAGTNGLVITGSRFRNLFADGVNFCNGTSNSRVEN
ncbi:MAG TPA: glycosyl hydrolase family 28-related protein, partial [Anaerolineales bacterium]|nr:glycosyl hydrolase family 28-related protein [Anaerolineales bacterium]